MEKEKKWMVAAMIFIVSLVTVWFVITYWPNSEDGPSKGEPTIVMLGSNPQYVITGNSYDESGALAFASEGGYLEVAINSSNVNTLIAGNYTVFYEADGVVVNRTIVVYEIEKGIDTTTLASQFARVLLGEGIDKSSPYVIDNNTVHPIVLLNEMGGEHSWHSMVPLSWQPESVEDNELVLLIEAEEASIFGCICHYTNGTDIIRLQYSINITLYSSKTGETLNASTIFGSEPRECLPSEPSCLEVIEGDNVEWAQIEEWLFYNNLNLSP